MGDGDQREKGLNVGCWTLACCRGVCLGFEFLFILIHVASPFFIFFSLLHLSFWLYSGWWIILLCLHSFSPYVFWVCSAFNISPGLNECTDYICTVSFALAQSYFIHSWHHSKHCFAPNPGLWTVFCFIFPIHLGPPPLFLLILHPFILMFSVYRSSDSWPNNYSFRNVCS